MVAFAALSCAFVSADWPCTASKLIARCLTWVQHKGFGAVAAAWGMLEDLGVAAIIDQAAGARRADAGASVGAYLVLAALNRVVAPCSKLAFADWWAKTASANFGSMSSMTCFASSFMSSILNLYLPEIM